MGKNGYLPLFETKPAGGLVFFRSYAASIFIGICFICFHRVSYFPVTERWVWVGMFVAELWFSFYFFITVIVKWNPVFRSTFKDRLSSRFEEEELPGVDIFVCTADPRLEPPTMVVSTVLSVMAYDYPPHKLSVYLSDDGCSDLTFYALLEASRFAQLWLPFCRKLKVEPTSPEAYFQTTPEPVDDVFMANEWLIIKKSYEDMKNRIESITSLGKVPAYRRKEHNGFDEWDFVLSPHHHPSILQILIDGRDPNAIDIEGKALPTLVYLAREKRPQIHHNFKAGALNALLELAGFDGNGGPCYVGTGCVHRRESLSGMKYSEELAVELKAMKYDKKIIGSASFNEEDCKALASCTYEENTPWGKEKGVKYESLVEDVLTGMSIQSKGWRSVFFNPQREAFLGMGPTTLLDTLVQHKRWGEGELQILLSKHCPFVYGRPNMPLKLQLSYCIYNLWAPNCFATLYYVFVPSFCLFRGISLFPKISSSWGIPYLYVIFVHRVHSLVEYVWLGGTVRGWLNEQRMWMFKRTTSYLFAAIDHMLKLFGFSKSAFAITGKVADDDVHRRYEQEIMEFGTWSPMFTVLATLALFNLLGLIAVVTNNVAIGDARMKIFDVFGFQILLCYVLVFINLPIYQGMFFRKDSVSVWSTEPETRTADLRSDSKFQSVKLQACNTRFVFKEKRSKLVSCICNFPYLFIITYKLLKLLFENLD
ncbi:cellulose synthase-like protein E1 isoform X4 [Gossypium hirsutum]|uniref:Cellulose synthase-like protein E1 isoform X4 n=1 Tax=Gossypium hirsutum TaxID=3635 RepID=A0ABM2ZFH1_GOSHI|nr:cellulose synthase-like protein E1 isoform X4 [Gossypium hirsutum]